MADISKIITPDGTEYNIKDATARSGLSGKQATITASGVLIGDGSGGVTAKTLDTSSLSNDNDHVPTSGVVKSAIDAVDKVKRSYITNGSTITISTTAGSSAHILVLSRANTNLLVITSYWSASYFVAAGVMPSGITITKTESTNNITISNNTGLSLGYLYI